MITTGELANILGGFLITDLDPSGILRNEGGVLLLNISVVFLALPTLCACILGRLLTFVMELCDTLPTDTTEGSLTPSICLGRLLTGVVTSFGSKDVFILFMLSTSPEEYDLLSLVRRRFLVSLGKPEFADFDGNTSILISPLEFILLNRLNSDGGF